MPFPDPEASRPTPSAPLRRPQCPYSCPAPPPLNPLKALREQLGKLQRLAQPYFLPLDANGQAASGAQFLLLILSLVAVVVGVTLLLLRAAPSC